MTFQTVGAMLPLKEKDKPVVQKLLAAGCCSRCVLRFCCTSVQAAFRQPEQETLKELQAFINNNEIVQDSPDSTEETKSHDASGSETRGDPPSKRAKLEHCASGDASKDGTVTVEMQEDEESHVCVACLGVLQEFCDVTRAIKIAAAVKAEQYEFDSLVLSVSLPPQLCVREHSCWLHVKKEVREKCMSLSEDDVIQVKEAFKWVMQGLIAKELGGVAVVTKSLFEVGVEFSHPETDSDCYFLASTCPNCFKPTKNKQSVFTRMAVVKALDKISDFAFLKHYPSPPARPSRHCVQQDVQCLHVSLFIAGRYNKFCRSLPQTPWVIDGQRRMESSVEELIAAPILVTFRADGFNFSSSGREDVDVRTLGNGRPFAMELLNPHRSRVSKVEMKQLQETINASSDKIRVRDLQIVTREATSRMKEGEEEKTKSYTALVWTHKAIQREDLSFMDDIKDLTLNQKTPLRVLHRRALAVRQRVIHSMSTSYIKEFVHGDFGRTQPNMCELLKTDTDILELDVESVDVDWPPTVTD
ncbi:tRNA pseudouridine synthase Pus10 isoform X3 [Takifugu rubripes]|uniref:tRNA pseudouridine synthase Pus10 isoform X3 n=1 Tax=Takifugu rubripes TaxID=31033 RepID=UPI001145411D|nr:putative tRNA pseudouridine synthase Pus10 isoform X3 [Takifugu rubripes]